MCGIVGYIGKNKAQSILIDGLRRLEYRGYDSAGISIINDGKIETVKAVGKIEELEKKIKKNIDGNVGIAHTRWATHGKPSVKNSHPHTECTKNIFLVHNGIIENYQDLKSELLELGHKFISDTDSEVVAHVIEDLMKKNDFETSVRKAMKVLKGTYGFSIINKNEPEKLVIARNGSPLILGIGKDEYIVASDASAIIRHTNKVVYLEDGEMAVLEKDGYSISSTHDETVTEREESEIDWSIEEAEKQGFDHFMMKEIFEQPQAVSDAIRGRVNLEEGNAKLGGLRDVEEELRNIERIIIVSCGTSYYAGLVGEYMIEEYAGIPVEVEYASEFRYRKPILDKKTAVIAISQSGETADTLAAIREAKNKGALTLGIVNAVGSTIARETDAGVYNHAGPEIGVASTKAFTSQLSILVLFTLFLGRQREMSLVTGQRIAKELKKIPKLIEEVLEQKDEIKKIAKKYVKYNDFLYMGRKYNMPIAYEGALKLKEISYIHAEGYPSGEMKHGPIALIDEKFPSVFIAPKDSVYEKNISGIEEIRARKGKVLVVATKGDNNIQKVSDDVIYIPKTLEMLTPIVATIPLQILSYYAGVMKGYDVDKPRNLAKSVTVE